ncbi:MAG: methyl-accepting chemotaxis protein, partial [Thermoleophilia bacterium]|nr:methyl-accepting chemotaxis protein [Thermoleophilia bacterium]
RGSAEMKLAFLSRLRIRARLLAGFITVLGLSAVIGVVAWTQLRSTSSTYDSVVQNEARATKDALEMESALLDQVIGVRGYIMTGDETYLKPYAEGTRRFEAEVAAVADRNLGETRTAMLAAIRERYARLGPVYEQEIALVRAGKPKAAIALAETRGKPSKDAVVAQIEGFIRRSEEKMYANAAAARSGASTSGWVVLGLLAGALVLGALIALLIARSITGPLGALNARLAEIADGDGDLTARVEDSAKDELGDVGRVFNRFVAQIQDLVRQAGEQARGLAQMAREMTASSDQTGRAVAEIAATVDGVAKGSGDQAEAVQGVTETVAEMSRGVAQVAEAGQSAARQAAGADDEAGQGAERIGEARQAMTRISTSSAGVYEVVGQLDTRSQAIGEIVGTITQIAGQTNLLALNAAIEAARAGEQGRGFAVVADEVRKLAEESQAAAGSIGEILGEIQAEARRAVQAMADGKAEVEQGQAVVEAAGEAFGRIRAQVQQVASEIAGAAAGAEQLEAGAQDVQERIAAVAAVSQENAAAAEQVASATEETTASVEEVVATTHHLADAAERLEGMVARFRV